MARESIPAIWGNANPSGIVEPSASTQNNGYAAVKPPYQEHNWLFNLMTDMLQNAEQNGIMEWSTDTTYPQHGLALGSDGNVYKSQLASNQGNDPTIDSGTNWKKLISEGVAYTSATDGYLKLPDWLGGFIFQWMLATESTGATNVRPWPTPFPTAAFSATVTPESSSGQTGGGIIEAITTSGIIFRAGDFYNNGQRAYIIAIGH